MKTKNLICAKSYLCGRDQDVANKKYLRISESGLSFETKKIQFNLPVIVSVLFGLLRNKLNLMKGESQAWF